MIPTNLTCDERERWAYAENDQPTLLEIYCSEDSGTGQHKSRLVARTEVLAAQQVGEQGGAA